MCTYVTCKACAAVNAGINKATYQVYQQLSVTFVVLKIGVGVLTIVYCICFFFVPDSVQSFPKESNFMIFKKAFVAADMRVTMAFFLHAY